MPRLNLPAVAARIAVAAILFALAIPARPDEKIVTYPLADPSDLIARNVKLEAAEYQGRKAVRITKDANQDGLALVKGADFHDGTIEVDLAVKVPPLPPGGRNPGFIGVAFRTRPDASAFELFYIRPGNSHAPDQGMRNHSVQYTSEPGYGWHKLRTEWPWIYEGHAELQPEAWTKLKIEVAGRSARLFVNGEAQPSLIVDGLKGQDLHGGIALWSTPGQEAYFSNLRVTPSAPQAVKNGGEAAGTWEVKSGTDAGPVAGTLKLAREGAKLRGTWSGTLGAEQPVTGTWRDGYVEFSFTGDWPKEAPGKPGSATANFAGWIDNAAAKGRLRIENRADGQWTASRKEP